MILGGRDNEFFIYRGNAVNMVLAYRCGFVRLEVL